MLGNLTGLFGFKSDAQRVEDVSCCSPFLLLLSSSHLLMMTMTMTMAMTMTMMAGGEISCSPAVSSACVLPGRRACPRLPEAPTCARVTTRAQGGSCWLGRTDESRERKEIELPALLALIPTHVNGLVKYTRDKLAIVSAADEPLEAATG